MASDSPWAGLRHWSLLRATWPSRAPWSPTAGSYANGSMVASRPSAVSVIRSAAPCRVSSSRTVASAAAKWAGMYMAPSRLAAEGPGQAGPHGVVVALAVGPLQGLAGRAGHPAALGHGRPGGVAPLRPRRRPARPLGGLGLRAVRGAGVVQAP